MHFLPILAVAVLAAALPSQASQPSSAPQSLPTAAPLAWPRDKDRVLATVAGDPFTLAGLMRHIEERHAPGILAELDAGVHEFTLRSPLVPVWVRAYADSLALQREARARGIENSRIELAMAAALKRSFEVVLADYVEQRMRQARQGDINQGSVNQLLARYQKDHGIESEVLGLLDVLVPDEFTEDQVYVYFNDNSTLFGGHVTFAHILVHHRDPINGALLDADGVACAQRKIVEIKSRLKPDGSNFTELAARMSDDLKTARRGGLFENVKRFDGLIPPDLTRAAWKLADGEIAGPIESPYGLHLIRRISFQQTSFMIYAPSTKPEIRSLMRQHRQEDFLFAARTRVGVVLKY